VLGGVGFVLAAAGTTLTDIHSLLDEFLPAHGAGGNDPFSAFEEMALRLAQARGRLSTWGAPLFLWFASRLFATARTTLNQVFDVPERRRFYVTLGLEVALVLITTALFAANALITGPTFGDNWVVRFLALCSAFGFSVILFGAVYLLAPARRLPWHTIVVASLVASLAFEVAKRLFALYVAEFVTLDRLVSNANVIGVLLFIIWFYYMAAAFLLGAEVGAAYDEGARERAARTPPPPPAPPPGSAEGGRTPSPGARSGT
jgi:membrane protein